MNYDLDEELRTCIICGKQFLPAPYHVYKVQEKTEHGRKGRMLWCCSWTCFNKCKEKYTKFKTKNN